MCDPPERIYNINGHRWRDVTNETVVQMVYSLADVIRAGGRVPSFDSTEGCRADEDEKD